MKLDGDFVRNIEAAIRIEALGLTTPSIFDDERRPTQWLSKNWHRLLEDCLELTMQASLTRTAAVSLSASSNDDMPHVEVGKLVDYHFRSWFIHANTLAERACSIIDRTTGIYLADSVPEGQIAKRHKQSVHEEVSVLVEKQRNAYAHGTTRSWASGITEDRLWERLVASSMTPTRFLGEFRYPAEADNVGNAKYHWLVDATTTVCDSLGSILQRLERDIVNP